MKKVIILLVAVCIIATIAVSASESPTVPVKIGMAMIDHTNPGFVGIFEGASEAAKDYGCEIIWKSCGGSLDKQIDIIRGFIQQKVDVIQIDSVDVYGITPVVNEATEAGIGVLAIGSLVSGKDNYSAVYPDKIDSTFAARVLGNIFYKDKKGTIGLIIGSPGNLVSDGRQKAFEETMAKEFPDLKVVTGIGGWDPQTAMKRTEDIIRANPDLLHMHVIQDGMSYGVLRAIKNSGKAIPMSSNDGDPEALQNFKNGDYILENLNGARRIGYWFVAISDFIGKGTPMAKIQYDTTYKIMSEGAKAMVIAAGIDHVDGNKMTIVTVDEAIEIGKNYRNEFAPDVYKPTAE